MREQASSLKSRILPPAAMLALLAAAATIGQSAAFGQPQVRFATPDPTATAQIPPAIAAPPQTYPGYSGSTDAGAVASPSNTPAPFVRKHDDSLRPGAGCRAVPHASARRVQHAARRRGLWAGHRSNAQRHRAAAAGDIRSLCATRRGAGRRGSTRPVLRQPAAMSAAGRCLYAAADARTGLSLHAGRNAGLPLVRWPRQQPRRTGHQRHRHLRHLRATAAIFRAAPADAATTAATLDAADHARLRLALLGRPTVHTCRRLRRHAAADLRRLHRRRLEPGFCARPVQRRTWRPATASTPTSARLPTRAIASRARAWR